MPFADLVLPVGDVSLAQAQGPQAFPSHFSQMGLTGLLHCLRGQPSIDHAVSPLAVQPNPTWAGLQVLTNPQQKVGGIVLSMFGRWGGTWGLAGGGVGGNRRGALQGIRSDVFCSWETIAVMTILLNTRQSSSPDVQLNEEHRPLHSLSLPQLRGDPISDSVLTHCAGEKRYRDRSGKKARQQQEGKVKLTCHLAGGTAHSCASCHC